MQKSRCVDLLKAGDGHLWEPRQEGQALRRFPIPIGQEPGPTSRDPMGPGTVYPLEKSIPFTGSQILPLYKDPVGDPVAENRGSHPEETPGYEALELPCPVHGKHRKWWVKI